MKSTKRSLTLSVLSFMLCFCMLLGTTFAWFTDSVTSGVNEIVAGNLDIDVLHTNAKITTAETIASKTNLFTDANGNAMLWEPGAVSYENFTVKNLGTVALKYMLAMNIVDFNALDGHTLKEVLKVKVLKGNDILGNITRDAVAALDWSTTDTLDVFKASGALAAGASDEFQVIVYWQPTDNDNLWNVQPGHPVSTSVKGITAENAGNALFVEFGINVVATQNTVESDSFDNQYDALAANTDPATFINEKVIGSFTKEELENTTTTSDVTLTTSTQSDVEITAKVAKGVAEAELDKILAEDQQGEASDTQLDLVLNVVTTDMSERSITLDITMDGTVTTVKNDVKTTKSGKVTELTGYVTLDMELGTNLVNVLMTHSGKPMTKVANIAALPEAGDANYNANGYYSYNMTTGILSIATKSFSPFKVTYEIPDVITVGDGETLDLKTKFASDVTVTPVDASIATVDSNLVLTAKNAGQTMMNVDYGNTTEACLLNVTHFHSGKGTEADPYLIVNAKQMQNISLYCWTYYAYGAYYGYEGFEKMNWSDACDYADQFDTSYEYCYKCAVAEIDCSDLEKAWSPIYLSGSFDGNGVKFTNLTNSLFKCVTLAYEDQYLKNFTISDCFIVSNGWAAPIYELDIYDDVLVENVNISGYVEGNGAAGFACFLTPDSEEGAVLTVKDCISTADVVSTGGWVGGFFRQIYYGNYTHVYLKNSAFMGSLSAQYLDCCSYCAGCEYQPTAFQFHLDQASLDRVGQNFVLETNRKSTPALDKTGQYAVGQYSWGEEEGGIILSDEYPGWGTVCTYSKKAVVNAKQSQETFAIGDKLSVTADEGAVSAKAVLFIAPNDKTGSGCYTSVYMKELDMVAAQGRFTTNEIEKCSICINTCAEADANNFKSYYDTENNVYHIHNLKYGTTYYYANAAIIQYDASGAITSVTYFPY